MAAWSWDIVVAPGVNDINFNFRGFDFISQSSSIVASVCERGENALGPMPFLGIATMRVNNVVPMGNGTVTLRIESLWDEVLSARAFFHIS